MAVPALDVVELKKTYATGVEALKGVSLRVEPGDFFALLGPNGAGKSTLIGIVSSLVTPSGGRVEVFGEDLHTARERALAHVGLVPQELNFNQFEKPFDIVVNQGGFYGLPRRVAKERAERNLRALQLWDKAFVAARTLSGGMKRRLMIARAMVHDPRLLILDEPTAGVDFELRLELWRYIRRLHEGGTTILLTTHYLEEAEELCEEIALIRGGRLLARDTAAGLRETYDARTLADVYVKAMAA